MEYIPPDFTTLPSDKELENLLQLYFDVYGETAYKAGTTIKRKLFVRYTEKTIYKKLTKDSVFCGAKGELALEIEAKLIALLSKRGVCSNYSGDSGGTLTSIGKMIKDEDCYLYLAEKKDDDDKCQMCAKVWISDKEKQRKHIEEIHWEEVIAFNQAIKDLEARKEDNSELIASYKALLKWQHKDEAPTPGPSNSGISRKREYTKPKPEDDDYSD